MGSIIIVLTICFLVLFGVVLVLEWSTHCRSKRNERKIEYLFDRMIRAKVIPRKAPVQNEIHF